MKRLPILVAVMCGLAGCSASTTDTASLASALEVAQADFCTDRAAASACRETYDTCVTAAGADATATQACVDALHACLPPPPHARGGGDGCVGMEGDGGGPRGEHHHGDGGVDGHHGGRGGGHEGGRGPQPDAAAVQACRDAEQACLTADPADTTCVDTERQCVRAAFAAAFEAACTDAQAACTDASTEGCTEILARCAAGIGAGADGGSCAD